MKIGKVCYQYRLQLVWLFSKTTYDLLAYFELDIEHTDGLVQNCCISNALATDIQQSYPNPSVQSIFLLYALTGP